MSHKIESTAMARRESGLPIVKNLNMLKAACEVLGLKAPVYVTDRYIGMDRTGGTDGRVTGWLVKFPGWTNPCVFDLDEGTIAYDNWPLYDTDHAEVKAGRRRAGEEGQWGNWEHMLAFEGEYLNQAVKLGRKIWEEEMMAVGGMVQVESETEDELVLLCSQ